MAATDIEIPEPLVQAIGRGEAILFLGRGLAEELHGPPVIPSDRLMADELARLCNYSGSDRSLPAIAQYYHDQFGGRELIRHMKEMAEQVTQNGNAPIPAPYRLIAGLPFSAIVTTIQDDTLDRALIEQRRPYDKIGKDFSLPYKKTGKLPVIYLYGRHDAPDSIRVTQDDLDKVLRQDRSRTSDEVAYIQKLLTMWVGFETVVFIGFSTNDYFFRQFYLNTIGNLGDSLRQHAHVAYMFAADAPPKLYEDKYKLQIIPATSHNGLVSLYGQWLAQQVRAETPKFDAAHDMISQVRPRIVCCSDDSEGSLGEIVLSTAVEVGFRTDEVACTTVATRSLACLVAQTLAADLCIFDMRQDSAEMGMLMGACLGLGLQCLPLLPEAEQPLEDAKQVDASQNGLLTSDEQPLGAPWLNHLQHIAHVEDLRGPLLRLGSSIAQPFPRSLSAAPKLAVCLLIDLIPKGDPELTSELRVRKLVETHGLKVRRLSTDGLDISELSKIFHTANLVVVRSAAESRTQAAVLVGMALGTGASALWVTDTIQPADIFTVSRFLFLCCVPSDGLLSDAAGQFCSRLLEYPLPNEILQHVDDQIETNRDLRAAWLVCDRLAYALPNCTGTYRRRSRIYELCGQSNKALEQDILALNLNPREAAANPNFQARAEAAAERAFQENRFDELKAIVRTAVARGGDDKRWGSLIEGFMKRSEGVIESLNNWVRESSALRGLAGVMENLGGKSEFKAVTERYESLQKTFEEHTQLISQTLEEQTQAVKAAADAEMKQAPIIENEAFWAKLNGTLDVYRDRSLIEIRELTDQKARLQTELAMAQRQLDDLPRLQQREYDLTRRVWDSLQREKTLTDLKDEMESDLKKSREKIRTLEDAKERISKEQRELVAEIKWFWRMVLPAFFLPILVFTITLFFLHRAVFLIPVLVLVSAGATWWWWRKRPIDPRRPTSTSSTTSKPGGLADVQKPQPR